MSHPVTTFDLGRLGLSSGEGRRIASRIRLEPFELAGQTYGLTDPDVEVTLDVSRTVSGYALRLRFTAAPSGPCMRCLDPASIRLEVEAREVEQPGVGDEQLSSPYVDGDELAISDWARDALVLALPAAIVCRAECEGLCAVCGEKLAGADPEQHRHAESPDPRWAKLNELKTE